MPGISTRHCEKNKCTYTQSCGRQKNVSPNMVYLISETSEYGVLHGKRDFPDIIKVMDLKVRLSRIIMERVRTSTVSL